MGLDGFVWWLGVVENRNDPLNLGRCQVRIFGWHTENKMLIPSADLPWAMPMLPVNSTQIITIKEGDMVMGFFSDGSSAQQPVIMGMVPGIPTETPPLSNGFSDQRTAAELQKAPKKPKSRKYNTNGQGVTIEENITADRYPNVLKEPTTSRVARNEKIDTTLVQERKNNIVNVKTTTSNWSEPSTKYAAIFPYNKVVETESGHLFEIDDTPKAERISTTHRSGTFEEIHPDGSKVTKVVKNHYEIIMSDDDVYIMGNCNITIQNNATLYVKGDYDVKVDGNYNLSIGQNYNISVGKNIVGEIGQNYTYRAGGAYKTYVGKTYLAYSVGNMKLNSPRIDFN